MTVDLDEAAALHLIAEGVADPVEDEPAPAPEPEPEPAPEPEPTPETVTKKEAK